MNPYGFFDFYFVRQQRVLNSQGKKILRCFLARGKQAQYRYTECVWVAHVACLKVRDRAGNRTLFQLAFGDQICHYLELGIRKGTTVLMLRIAFELSPNQMGHSEVSQYKLLIMIKLDVETCFNNCELG